MVEVALWVPQSLPVVKGKAKVPAPPQPVQEVTVRAPIAATLARRLVVEARLETKKSVVVALWRVVEPRTKRLVEERLVEVAEVVVPWKAEKVCKVVEPRWRNSPVVVAPPKIVKPLAVVLLPMVEEAKE